MPNLLDEITTRLGAQWGYLTQAQEAYRAAHGAYYQGAWTHTEAPTGGAEVAPDLDSHPLGQQATWRDVGGLPTTMAARLRIDTYDGPHGAGYVVVMQTRLDGVLWERRVNVGAETERESEWRPLFGEDAEEGGD